MGPDIDAMCVVVCGGVWLCVVSAGFASGQEVSCGLGSHLVREASLWYDASVLSDFPSSFSFFFSFLGLPEKDCLLIIKKLNVQCCTTCPKH